MAKKYIEAEDLMHRMYERAFETDGDTMWQSGCWVRYRAIEAVVKETPAVDIPRWIPVTERLPAYGEDVILSMYGDYCIGYLVSTYEGIGYEWHHSGYIYDFDEVQAWMPLPEPYKEGEQE